MLLDELAIEKVSVAKYDSKNYVVSLVKPRILSWLSIYATTLQADGCILPYNEVELDHWKSAHS